MKLTNTNSKKHDYIEIIEIRRPGDIPNPEIISKADTPDINMVDVEITTEKRQDNKKTGTCNKIASLFKNSVSHIGRSSFAIGKLISFVICKPISLAGRSALFICKVGMSLIAISCITFYAAVLGITYFSFLIANNALSISENLLY